MPAREWQYLGYAGVLSVRGHDDTYLRFAYTVCDD